MRQILESWLEGVTVELYLNSKFTLELTVNIRNVILRFR